MQQIVNDFTSSQTHLEKSFQLLHLLDFCLLHYLLSSDSKAMAKVSKLHTSFFKTKKNKLVFYIIFVKGNTSRFGSAIQVLPSDIRKYFSSFLITAVAVVSISMFIFCYWKLYFFMDVNSYVGNKVDLTCLCWCLFDNFGQLSGLCIVSYFASQSLGVLS